MQTMNPVHNKKVALSLLKRRKKGWQHKEPRSVDSTAMGDIAFLLLIFFIITSSFIIRQGLFLSLPPFGGAAVRVEKNQLIDIFPRDNGFGLDNKVIDRKAFKTLLSDRASADPATVLRINMEAKIRYDRLMDALSVAKEVGLTRISLRNEGSMR